MYIKNGVVVLTTDMQTVTTSKSSFRSGRFSIQGPYGQPLAGDLVAFGRASAALEGEIKKGSALTVEGVLETRSSRGANYLRLVVSDVLGINDPGGTGDLKRIAAAFERRPDRFVPGWDTKEESSDE